MTIVPTSCSYSQSFPGRAGTGRTCAKSSGRGTLVRAVTTQTALAAAASLVALAFALSTFERWLDRRRPHELPWCIALAMFTAGSAALWLGASKCWDWPTCVGFCLVGD